MKNNIFSAFYDSDRKTLVIEIANVTPETVAKFKEDIIGDILGLKTETSIDNIPQTTETPTVSSTPSETTVSKPIGLNTDLLFGGEKKTSAEVISEIIDDEVSTTPEIPVDEKEALPFETTVEKKEEAIPNTTSSLNDLDFEIKIGNAHKGKKVLDFITNDADTAIQYFSYMLHAGWFKKHDEELGKFIKEYARNNSFNITEQALPDLAYVLMYYLPEDKRVAILNKTGFESINAIYDCRNNKSNLSTVQTNALLFIKDNIASII